MPKSHVSQKMRWLTGCATILAAGAMATSANAQSTTNEPGQEQAPSENSDQPGDIIVTGSRIDRSGYESPTPLLRVTQEELQVVPRANLGAALADLPQFKAAESPVTSSANVGAGRFPINIRGLGDKRSLLLLDGRRLVSSDLNTVPSIMIGSVDIVTGGASAAWGSDAVGGIVNLNVDGDYAGVRLGAEAGVSSRGDAQQYKVEGKFGTSFADGRGHFVIGGEFVDNKGIPRRTDRENTGRWSTNGNIALTPNVGYSTRLAGGYINSGVLRGNGFNPDGSLRTPNLGTIIGSSMIGGEAPSNDDIGTLIVPQRRYAAMAKASYELTDTLKISADLRYSRYYNRYPWFGAHNDNLTIRSDNAFLRPEIKSRLAAAGQTSFLLSRFNGDLSFADIDVDRRNIQGSIALDGSFGGGRWRYTAFYSHGEYRNDLRTPGFPITQNFNNAVDAVISPTTNQPICRVTLTNPSSGCVPLNLFGLGAPSQAAIDYVTGTPQSDTLDKLDTYGVSLRGEPFDLPAGPVSVAIGAEGRNVSTGATIGTLDAASAFSGFNFSGFSGRTNVKEAFAETVVPVVKDLPLLRKLELNGAVRVSDYSLSGTIWSWKLGITNEFFPGVIGRVARSRDIRAPNLAELYTTRTISNTGIVDPQNPAAGTASTLIYGGGNTMLVPERADTWTAGFTTAPMRGLTASIDYFNVSIRDVISTLGAQNIVNRCSAGNADLCRYIDRNSAGIIQSITSSQFNLSQLKTDGIDAELAYTVPVNDAADGRINIRLVGTWVNSFTTDDGISKIEYTGTQGYAFAEGTPRIRANATIGYASDGFSGLVRARYISSGYWDRTRPTLTNNRIPAYTYFDVQLSQKVPIGDGRSFEFYGSISNLFDKDPPLHSSFTPYYDVIGRYMSVGARLEF
jgi:iron complex outermembrane receptor protein